MAPEQARGHAVDKRADIWAFGVVLYEMLTGRRPFQGATVPDLQAAVLTTEPAWDQVPAIARPLLQHCLMKDPKRRLRDIGDIDLLLDGGPKAAPARRSWVAWSAAAILLLTLGPIAFLHLRERPPQVGEAMRFQIPATVTLAASGNMALSPDGRYLAFLGVGADGRVRVWIRTMDSLEVRPLEGSETGVNGPPFFWSPDSRFIAFDAGGSLKKAEHCRRPRADALRPVGLGHWRVVEPSRRHHPGHARRRLLRVPADGGAVSRVTALDPARKENAHLLPTFLPDGQHFVYLRMLESRRGWRRRLRGEPRRETRGAERAARSCRTRLA